MSLRSIVSITTLVAAVASPAAAQSAQSARIVTGMRRGGLEVHRYETPVGPGQPSPDEVFLGPPSSLPIAPQYEGVRVALGNFNGDAIPDYVVSNRSNGVSNDFKVYPASVLVLDGTDPNIVLAEFEATKANGGYLNNDYYVAAGDLDGNGLDDVILGASDGSASRVAVSFTGTGVELLVSPLGQDSSSNSRDVAAGDFDGDGIDELVSSAVEPAGADSVAEFVVGSFLGGSYSLLHRVTPFGTDHWQQIRLAAGDVDGDGLDEVVVGSTASPQVSIFDVTLSPSAAPTATLLSTFVAFGGGYTGGVDVEAVDVDGDQVAEVIVSPRTGGQDVAIFGGFDTLPAVPTLQGAFQAYASGHTGGVEVGGAAGGLDLPGYECDWIWIPEFWVDIGIDWVQVRFGFNPAGKQSKLDATDSFARYGVSRRLSGVDPGAFQLYAAASGGRFAVPIIPSDDFTHIDVPFTTDRGEQLTFRFTLDPVGDGDLSSGQANPQFFNPRRAPPDVFSDALGFQFAFEELRKGQAEVHLEVLGADGASLPIRTGDPRRRR